MILRRLLRTGGVARPLLRSRLSVRALGRPLAASWPHGRPRTVAAAALRHTSPPPSASAAAAGAGTGTSTGERVLNFEFGLSGVFAPIQAYRAATGTAGTAASAGSSAAADPAAAVATVDPVAALDAASAQIATEVFARQLQAYIRKRFLPAKAAAATAADDPDAARKNRAYAWLSRWTAPVAGGCTHTRLDGDALLSEHQHRVIRVGPLPHPLATALATALATTANTATASSAAAAEVPAVCFEFRWRTERQKLMGGVGRGGLTVYDASLVVDGELVLAMTDCACEFQEPAFDALYDRLVLGTASAAGAPAAASGSAKPESPALTRAEFAWFVSWVCTHPSDDAFDVLSGGLTGNPPTAFE